MFGIHSGYNFDITTRDKNPQYNLRMPSDLKEELNAEILLRLEESRRSMNYHSGELPSAAGGVAVSAEGSQVCPVGLCD